MMKIYVVERKINLELTLLLKKMKYNITDNFSDCSVVIVSKIKNNKEALNIVEVALQMGKEVVCFRPERCPEDFVCSILSREGAVCV